MNVGIFRSGVSRSEWFGQQWIRFAVDRLKWKKHMTGWILDKAQWGAEIELILIVMLEIKAINNPEICKLFLRSHIVPAEEHRRTKFVDVVQEVCRRSSDRAEHVAG